MNFFIYFFVALAFPMLICCRYNLGPVNLDNFMTKLIKCINAGTITKPEYKKCVAEEQAKIKGIMRASDPKFSCCIRVVGFICLKASLSSNCGVPEEEVDNNDSEHF